MPQTNRYIFIRRNMNYDELTQEAVDLLCRLIETPRISREENDAVTLLAGWMKQRGIEAERHGNNLVVRSRNNQAGRPTLLLNAHIDTVRPTNAWSCNPHKATIEGDRLTGLGSNDDGASLVCLTQVFRLLARNTDLPYNLILAISSEEEVSGKGGMESLVPLLGDVDVALVGEPTGMQPAIAEKGLMVVDVVAHGKAGHAAREEGDNAIYHALDDIQWVRNHQFERVSPLLGPVKTTVTIVNAGTQHNVVPAECTFTIDVRSNELYTNQELFQTLQAGLKGEATARSFRLGSSRIAENHPLVQAAVALGRTPFGSPTLSDQALMPWPSMKMGPGDSQRSHTANEYIFVSEIRDSIEIYHRMLCNLQLIGPTTSRD